MSPLTISMDPRDNVVIVANDGGLPAGTILLDVHAKGIVLKDGPSGTTWEVKR